MSVSPERGAILGWRNDHMPFDRSKASAAVHADLAAAGWRPPREMPNKSPIVLFQRGQILGDFDGSGAFILEDGFLFLVDPRAPYHAFPEDILGWKRWTRESYKAFAQPSRGRRG